MNIRKFLVSVWGIMGTCWAGGPGIILEEKGLKKNGEKFILSKEILQEIYLQLANLGDPTQNKDPAPQNETPDFPKLPQGDSRYAFYGDDADLQQSKEAPQPPCGRKRSFSFCDKDFDKELRYQKLSPDGKAIKKHPQGMPCGPGTTQKWKKRNELIGTKE